MNSICNLFRLLLKMNFDFSSSIIYSSFCIIKSNFFNDISYNSIKINLAFKR